MFDTTVERGLASADYLEGLGSLPETVAPFLEAASPGPWGAIPFLEGGIWVLSFPLGMLPEPCRYAILLAMAAGLLCWLRGRRQEYGGAHDGEGSST